MSKFENVSLFCEHKNVSVLGSNSNQIFNLCNTCNAEITKTYEYDEYNRIVHIEIEIEFPDEWIPSEMRV